MEIFVIVNRLYCYLWEIFNMKMQKVFSIHTVSCFNKGILRKLKYHIDIL